MIDALGLRGTALAAACLNVAAATLALGQPAGAAPAAAVPAPDTHAFPMRLLFAAAATGGIALALEVIWFRLLILYAPGSDLNFALMLTVVLLGIAIGGALAPRLARLQFVWVAVGSSFAVTLGYLLAGRTLGSGRPDLIQFAVVLMLPAAILSGSLFTLLGAQLRAGSTNPQPLIVVLTTANTLGAALGAALAGTGYDFYLESDYLAQINEAIMAKQPPFVIQSIIYKYLQTLYYPDVQGQQIFNLISQADRLLTMTLDEINLKLSKGLVDKWEVVLHDSAINLVNSLMMENPAFFEQDFETQLAQLVERAKNIAANIQLTTAAPFSAQTLVSNIVAGI